MGLDDVTVLLCGSSQTYHGTLMPSGGGGQIIKISNFKHSNFLRTKQPDSGAGTSKFVDLMDLHQNGQLLAPKKATQKSRAVAISLSEFHMAFPFLNFYVR